MTPDQTKAHRLFSLIVTLSLYLALIPLPVWAHLARQAPIQTVTPTQTINPASLTGVESAESLQSLTTLTGRLPAAALNTATSPAPLQIGRAQSAYSADAAPDHTMVVTFTVRNTQAPLLTPTLDPNTTLTETLAAAQALDYSRDPHTIRHIILTDAFLPPQAIVLAASQPVDNDGPRYVWNLGDLGPLAQTTVTVTLAIPASVLDFTELDTGATAWGTLSGAAVTASAAPARLAPDGFAGWLNCTIDANCQDTYVAQKAAELGGDPAAIFAFVQSLGYNSYQGSLRGARGTLWSAAGNSVDKASLLIALLRANGIPAAYRHGPLDETQRDELILAMFPPVNSLGGFVPDDALRGQPTLDEQLQAEAADHWWVQAYLPDQGWTHLDPTFPNANIGDFVVPFPAPEQLAELPDSLRHKVAIKLKVEDYHPLNIGESSPGLAYNYPLSVTFRTVELVGQPVSLGHFVETSGASGFVFFNVQHTYTPYLAVGPQQTVIEGKSFMELLSNFPLGTFLVTAEWLLMDLIYPDGRVERHEREIFDHIGYEARQAGGVVYVEPTAHGTDPTISEQSLYTMLFAPSAVAPQAISDAYPEMVTAVTQGQAAIASVQDLIDSGVEPGAADLPRLRAAQRQMTTVTRLSQQMHLFNYAAAADLGLGILEDTYLVKAYYDSPRILMVAWERDETADANRIQFDLRRDKARGVLYPGQSWTALQAFHFSRGVLDAALEGQLLEHFSEGQVVSVYHVFQAAADLSIPLQLITPVNTELLGELSLSAEAKARILTALQDPGKVVVVPSQMVTLNGAPTVGWYVIDVISGETVDVMEDGQHTALVEYGMIISKPNEFAFAIIGFFHGFAAYGLSFLGFLMADMPFTEVDLKTAWTNAVQSAEASVTEIANKIGFALDVVGGCFQGTPLEDAVGWLDAYISGAGVQITLEVDIGDFYEPIDELDDAIDLPDWVECLRAPFEGPGAGDVGGTGVKIGGDGDDIAVEIEIKIGGFVNGANFAKGMIGEVDPPLPGALFSGGPATLYEPTVTTSQVNRTANQVGGSVMADLSTAYTILAGEIEHTFTSSQTTQWRFSSLNAADGVLLASDGSVLGSGSINAQPIGTEAALATWATPVATASSAAGGISLYAPAIEGLAGGTLWRDLTTSLTPGQPFTLTLDASQVTLNGGQVFTGGLRLVTSEPVTLVGAGATGAPTFAPALNGQIGNGALAIGPASGALTIGSQALDPGQGIALTQFSGQIRVTAVSTTTDQVTVSGSADYFTLSAQPPTSTTPSGAPTFFAAQLDTTFDDVFTVTVSAPPGWLITLDGAGLVSATPPLTATPGDYRLGVTAQSRLTPELLLSAEHRVTVLPVDGVILDVRPDPIFTIPWGPDNQLQLPDAGYTLWVTNTSNIARTFDVNLTGLEADWLLFNGQTGQDAASVNLAPGSVALVGLYISPTLTALPPAGTAYPFDAVVVAEDNPAVADSDSDIFTIPAVPFNTLTVEPGFQFAAPDMTRTLAISLTNIGNAAADFPLSATLPDGWTLDGLQGPVSLSPAASDAQSVTVNIPADAPLGLIGRVRLDSPAPGSEYVQQAAASIQIVSTNVLPIYEVVFDLADGCAIPGRTISLPASLGFLGQSLDGLERSCAGGACGLDWRDQTASAVIGVANAAEPVSPLITQDEALRSLAAQIGTHTTAAEFSADAVALRSVVVQLGAELCAVAQHNLSARFIPGAAVVLPGAPAPYLLSITNVGSQASSVALNLTASPSLSSSWATQTATLAAGETLSVPTVITATQLGTYLFQAELTVQEAPTVQMTVPASLSAVDALLKVSRMTATPAFVEYGTGTAVAVAADIANVTNLPLSAAAHLAVLAPGNTLIYSDTEATLIPSSILPLQVSLGSLTTAGLLTGTYTVTLSVLDEAGQLIPDGLGFTSFGVGQQVEADANLAPALVPPGTTVVTTTLDVRLSAAVLADLESGFAPESQPPAQRAPRSRPEPSDQRGATPMPAPDATPPQPINKTVSAPAASDASLIGYELPSQRTPETLPRPAYNHLALEYGLFSADPAHSLVTVTTPHQADGLDTAFITVVARDADNNPSPGSQVWLAVTGQDNTLTPISGLTDAAGIFTATLTSLQAEAKWVRAQVDGAWLPNEAPVEFTGAVISGAVFNDLNRDNIRDDGEGGLSGVQVTLYALPAAAPVRQTVTDAAGAYSFSGLTGSAYLIEQTHLAQYALSGTGVLTVTVANFALSPDHDFGNYAAAQVEGQVWNDSNQNGQIDDGEIPLAGVRVDGSSGGNLVDSAVSDAAGHYHLGLAAPLPTAPTNFVFNSGRLQLQEPADAVIPNGDFGRGLTPLDAATYPANYDFASGDLGGWTPSDPTYVAVVDDVYSHDGFYLRLDRYNVSAESPAFAVPPTTHSLRFNYFVWSTRDSAASRPLHVYALTGPTFTVSNYLGAVYGANLQGWLNGVLDLQLYQGQTIKLRFLSDTDGYWGGRARLDNLSLNVEAPDWSLTNAANTAVQTDSYSLDAGYLHINSYNQSAYSAPFTIPEQAQSLRFDYLNWSARDSTVSRPLYVYLLSGNTSALLGSVNGSLTQGWSPAVFDIQTYRGQTVRLRLLTDTDGYWGGRARVDNLALYTETPGWTPSNALYVRIGQDAPPAEGAAAPSNSDFELGLTPIATTTYPLNFDFSRGRTFLPASDLPANAGFDMLRQPLDPATYPANYDFSAGVLGDWVPSNATYVTVVDDIYGLDGPYVQINSYNQSVTSPAFTVPTATQSLRFDYYSWSTRDTSASRPLHVYVLSGADFANSTYLGAVYGTDVERWRTAALDVQAFQGQTVKLRFLSDTDGYWAGRARLDNVTLHQDLPLGWQPSTTNYEEVQILDDAFALDGPYLRLDGANRWATSPAFIVPFETQSLRFSYYNWTTRDSNTARPLYIYALSGPDFGITTLLGSASGSDTQRWQTAVMDIQAFRGQTVKLRIASDTDGYWNGRARVDGLSLAVETPDWQVDNASAASVTNNSDGYPDSGNYLFLSSYSQSAYTTPFVVSADTQALRFNYYNDSPRDTTVARPLYVYAYTGPDLDIPVYLGSVSGSRLNGWRIAIFDLQAYQGQTIRLRFLTDTDGYWGGRARLDNLQLSVETPGWQPNSTTYGGVTIRHDTPPVNPPTSFSNGDFSQGRFTYESEDYLPNHDFSLMRNPLSPAAYPPNYDFSAMRQPLDPATYPANYNFSTGDLGGWTVSNPDQVQVISDTYNLDGHYLRLNDYSQSAYSPIFTVPEAAQSLRFDYFNWTTRDNNVARPLHVYALSGPGLSIATALGSVNGAAVSGWQRGVLDLQAFQGKTIQLRFLTDTDGYWAGRARLDNVTLHLDLTHGWTPTNVSYEYVQIISDTFNLNGPYLRLNSTSQGATTPVLSIPWGAQSLRFNYFNWTTRDSNTARPLYVYALSGPGFAIATSLGSVSGAYNDNWRQAALDIQAYQGREIKLYFLSDTDGYWAGRARIDDISFNTELPAGWLPSNTAYGYVEIISDTYNLDGPYLLLNSTGQSAQTPAFTLPPDAQSLRFNYFNWTTRDANTARPLYVYALSGADYTISTYLGQVSGAANEGWKAGQIDIHAFQGQSIRLQFTSDTDGYWAGRARIDNLTLNVEAPGWTLSNSSLTSIQTGGIDGNYLLLDSGNLSAYPPPFIVPTTTTTLNFSYSNWTTRDNATARPLYVIAYTGDDFSIPNAVGTLSGSANQGWQSASLDMSPWRGRYVRLVFLTDTDGYWNGRSRIDNVQLVHGSGGPPLGSDYNLTNYAQLDGGSQSLYSAPFVVPTNTLNLTFDYFNWTTRDGATARPLHVYALTGPDNEFASLLGSVSSSYRQGWRSASLDLTGFRGQLVQLRFLSDTDGYWNGRSKIDDIVLTFDVNGGTTPAPAYEGTYLYLSNYNTSATSAPFTVSADSAALHLSYLIWTTRDTNTARPLYVYALSGPDFDNSTLLGTLSSSARQGWRVAALNITAFRNQTIQLRFLTDTDGYWGGRARLDNVYLTPLTVAPYAVEETNLAGYTSSTPDSVDIDAFGGAEFTINFGDFAVDRYQSEVAVVPTELTADGVSTAIVTVTLRDGLGQPLPGYLVELRAPGQAIDLAQPSAPTDAAGQVFGSLRSTYAPQVVLVTARTISDNVTLADAVPVTFIPGTPHPDRSSLTATPEVAVADGISPVTLLVTLRDAFDNLVPGKQISFTLQAGAPVTLTLNDPVSDAGGQVSATLQSAVAQTVTVTALDISDNVTLTQQALVRFASVDPSLSSVNIIPTTLAADGITSATLTVTLRAHTGAPLAGKPVAVAVSGAPLSINGQPATGLFELGVTDAGGIVTATLTAATIGVRSVTAYGDSIRLDEEAQVAFIAGPVDANASTLSADDTTQIADGASAATVTATLYDSYGHPVAGKTVLIQASGNDMLVTQPNTLTNDQGQVQAAIRSSAVQTVTVWAVDVTDGLTLTQTVVLTFVAGAVDAGQSQIVVTPTIVIANGVNSAVISATLRDNLGHPAAQRQVQLTVSGDGNLITPSPLQMTDEQGRAVWQLAATSLGARSLTLTDFTFGVALPAGQVTFVAAAIDPAASSLSADKTQVRADGVDAATVTATLRDQYGNPVAGQGVVISSTGALITITQPVTITNGSGQVQAAIRSTQPQTVTVAARAVQAGLTLSQTVDVAFVAGYIDPAQSSLTVTPRSAVANGSDAITVDATLHDSLGYPLAGRPIRLLLSGSNHTILPGNPATSDAAGHVVFTLRSTRAQSETVTLRDDLTNSTLEAGDIRFTSGPISAARSSVTTAAAQAPADGQTPIPIDIVLRDAYDNPIAGVNADISGQAGLLTTGAFTITQPAAPSDANGHLSASIVGTTYDPITLTAVAGGVTLDDQPVVRFLGPNLRVTKSGSAIGVVGRPLTYTLQVINNGLLPAADVTLSDVLPTALGYISDTSGLPVAFNSNTLTWALGTLGVGQTVTFNLVVLVNPAAPLGSQVINTAQAATSTAEADSSDNSASAAFTAAPGYAYSASVEPAAQTAAVDAYVTYAVVVRNTGNLPDTYNLSINNLNPAWYSLSPTSLTLQPGEVGSAELLIHTNQCSDAGSYSFFTLVSSAGAGNTRTAAANLILTVTPNLTDLRPSDNAAIGAVSALFTWQTDVSGATALFLRQAGDPLYTEYGGDPGRLHQVAVSGLARNTAYEWYVQTDATCGATTSPVRTLNILNGVEFQARTYNLAADRDYNQVRSIGIVNQDSVTHTVILTIENPFPELIVGFVGDGSVDTPLVLPPGQTRSVNIAFHAQDVTQEDFPLVARLHTDDGGGEPIQDAVPLNLHVEIPNFAFRLDTLNFDPLTLVTTYRLTNLGDPVTDMAISANTAGDGALYLQPGMTHGYLPAGGTFTFEAILSADSSFNALSGVIQASAGGVLTSTAISLSLPPGKSMFLGAAQDVSMEASTANWYCTNRPVINSQISLPAGFRRDDVARAELLMVFNPRSGWQQRPHDVDISFNDNPVGQLRNLIPEGLYSFPLDPSFLNESLYTPSLNTIRLATTHMNGGHYVVASDMLVTICLTRYREWVVAASQAEADAIVVSRSFLIPAPTTVDVTILSPSAGQTVLAEKPVLVQARVQDDVPETLFYNLTVSADNGNGAVILYDDGAHEDGGYRDGLYANTWTPVNPGPTTLTFHAASCTTAGESQIEVEVRAVQFDLDISHTIPLTGVHVLTPTIAPPPDILTTTARHTLAAWEVGLDLAVTADRVQVPLRVTDLRPGEVRQVSSGSVISYTGPGGQGALRLPPLSVVAPHLAALTPATRTVNLGSQTIYTATLFNPTAADLNLTWEVAGAPGDWVLGGGSLSLGPGATATRHLTVSVPLEAELATYPLIVAVATDNGGQDQAGATLRVVDGLTVRLLPKAWGAVSGATLTYTLLLTNPASLPRTYDLAVTGLASGNVSLPANVSVAANSSLTLPVRITADESAGIHTFQASATVQATNLTGSDDAVLKVFGHKRVGATLTPPLRAGGPGAPLTYTLTVANLGDMYDSYTFTLDLPAGWSYSLSANGAPITSLGLTPFLFHQADVILAVTPPVEIAPAVYPFNVTVHSQSQAGVSASAAGAAQVLAVGVTATVQPAQQTLAPTESGVWDVLVRNTGEAADSFTLTAGGIAAAGEFSHNPVSLAPGASTIVQLTAGPWPFALPAVYLVEVKAESLLDSRAQDRDSAELAFSPYHTVAVAWQPATQTVTNTYTVAYQLVVTNTGNTSQSYDLSFTAPGLRLTPEARTALIPPHRTARLLVAAHAPGAGSYSLTATAAGGDVTANATASLIIVSTNPPLVAAGDDRSLDEGAPLAFNGTFNDIDPGESHTIRWEFGDGAIFSGALTPTHPYLDNGIFSATLTVTDSQGLVGADTLLVTVNNVAPVVDAGPDQSVTEGAGMAFYGAFDDPGALDTHAITWEFGDGATISGTLTPTHTYAAYGVYTATLSVQDDDGASGDDSLVVEVRPQPLSLSLSSSTPGLEGRPISLTGTLSNPSQVPINAIQLSWGDGMTSTGSLSATHTYLDDGVYTATMTISHEFGVISASATLQVLNVAPTVEAGADQTVSVGQPVMFSGSFSDPGALDTHTVAWNFGDGVTLSNTLTPTHAYLDIGVFSVTLTVTDSQGFVGADSLVVTVDNAAPTVDVGPDVILFQGQTLAVHGVFSDPGANVWTGAVDYGAGGGSQLLPLLPDNSFDLSHLYPTIGRYTVTVTITDNYGGVGVDSLQVTVVHGFAQFCLYADDEHLHLHEEDVVNCNVGSREKVEVKQDAVVNGYIFSLNDKVDLAQDTQVLGDITAAKDVDIHERGLVGGSVRSGADIDLKKNSHIVGDATASEQVKLDSGASVGGIITEGAPAPSMPPITPAPVSVTPGATDVNVPKNSTYTLPPGAYKKLKVEEGATLILLTGHYRFESIDVYKNARLTLDLSGGDHNVIIDVQKDIDLKEYVQITANASAEHILFRVQQGHVHLHKNGVYLGTFLAPDGHIELHEDSTLVGALFGRDVDVKQRVQVTGAPAVGLLIGLYIP